MRANNKPHIDIAIVLYRLGMSPKPFQAYAPNQRDWDAEIEAIERAPAPRLWGSPPAVAISGQPDLPGIETTRKAEDAP